MIVLDTNQFSKAVFPHGPALGMIRKLASFRGRALAIPEMVAVELIAHHRHEVELSLKAARDALGSLSDAFGQDLAASISRLSAEHAAATYRAALKEVFTILPTPPGAAEEALRREANRMPPAEQVWANERGKKVKARGARDVAIWLTLLSAAESEKEVWFLSYDGDFGSTDGFHPALAEEAQNRLGESSGRLRLMSRGVKQLLEELAEEFTLPAQEVNAIMGGPVVRKAVTAHIATITTFLTLMPTAHGLERAYHSPAPLVRVDKVMEAKAYKVGERIWFSAHVRWQGTQVYTLIADKPTWEHQVGYSFDTTVLVQRGEEGAASVEVVATGPLLVNARHFVHLAEESEEIGMDREAFNNHWQVGDHFTPEWMHRPDAVDARLPNPSE